MKLATLHDGSRDGQLVVVSKDLTRYTVVPNVAPTLQTALDSWVHTGSRLREVAESMEHGSQPTERFHEHAACSPLPRAYQWIHADFSRDGTGEAAISQRASDFFHGPREAIRLADTSGGIDAQPGFAVIVDDVPKGADATTAGEAIRLVMLLGAISFQSEGPDVRNDRDRCVLASFSPVAVTPDVLNGAWDDSRVRLPLSVDIDGEPAGKIEGDEAMPLGFADLVAQAARYRRLAAGSIVSVGPANAQGSASSSEFHAGNRVRIEVRKAGDLSVFGAIEQDIEAE
ncbi:fumarylacetoacetate hydrolase family protein [Pararhizobium mangrovi]|nr:fumarylacetoacetate hydrolase family protein [Pararhizobium mangrovi]